MMTHDRPQDLLIMTYSYRSSAMVLLNGMTESETDYRMTECPSLEPSESGYSMTMARQQLYLKWLPGMKDLKD